MRMSSRTYFRFVPAEREEVRERVREQDDDAGDDKRHFGDFQKRPR